MLPSSGPPRTAYAEQTQYRNVLASLTTLCVQPALFEILIIRLSAKLDIVCSPIRQAAAGTADDQVECDAAYVHAMLSSLHEALQIKIEKKHVDIPKYADTLGEPIFWLFLRGSAVPSIVVPGTGSNSSVTVTSNPRVISAAAKLIIILVRSLPTE